MNSQIYNILLILGLVLVFGLVMYFVYSMYAERLETEEPENKQVSQEIIDDITREQQNDSMSSIKSSGASFNLLIPEDDKTFIQKANFLDFYLQDSLNARGDNSRNPNLQLRSDPVVPKTLEIPFSKSVLQQDRERLHFEIGE